MVSDEKAVSLMLNNGEIFSHRFTPHIWQKIQLLVIEEPLTLAWIAKTQNFFLRSLLKPINWIIQIVSNFFNMVFDFLLLETRPTRLIHESFLPSKWNLYPKLEFLA